MEKIRTEKKNQPNKKNKIFLELKVNIFQYFNDSIEMNDCFGWIHRLAVQRSTFRGSQWGDGFYG